MNGPFRNRRDYFEQEYHIMSRHIIDIILGCWSISNIVNGLIRDNYLPFIAVISHLITGNITQFISVFKFYFRISSRNSYDSRDSLQSARSCWVVRPSSRTSNSFDERKSCCNILRKNWIGLVIGAIKYFIIYKIVLTNSNCQFRSNWYRK